MKSEFVHIQHLPQHTLRDPDVHIWYGKMTDPIPVDEYFKMLDKNERARYEAYKAPKKQQEFLFGRFFIKSILSSYLAIPAAQIVLSINQHKRPYLSSDLSNDTLQFNLSHSFGAFALIVSKQHRVGIDIEYLLRRISIEEGRHVFMPEEIQSMREKDEQAAKREFLKRWTLKEAIYKAADQGPKLLFNEFQVKLEDLSILSESSLLPLIHRDIGINSVWDDYLFSYAIENAQYDPLHIKVFEARV